MPARHISSQSFDDILSDLGDDPAIPDPHGIRKPPPQQGTPPGRSSQGKGNSLTEPISTVAIKHLLQKLGSPAILIGVFIALAAVFFAAYNSLNSQSQSALEGVQKQLSDLKKDMTLMHDEIHQDQDDLYLAIDEIEVSIHSLSDRKPEVKVFNRPHISTHESELRRWRYLGASEMGTSHQAYFHTGKSHHSFEKGSQVLGDWRLSNIEKELVTLNNSQGKSLVLRALKSE